MYVLVYPLLVLSAVVSAIDDDQRSLSDRVAFACNQRPNLSFCAAKNAVPDSLVSAESAAAAAQAVHPDVVPVLQKELERVAESPVPKHHRWFFIPNQPTRDPISRSPAYFPAHAAHPKAEPEEPLLIIPPEPYKHKQTAPFRALQSRTFPVLPSDAAYGAGQVPSETDTFRSFDGLTDARGIAHRPRSRSPFTKPGLWEPNPDDPHSRDPANKWWYKPESVGVDWLNGQLQWGGHWAVPAAGIGGTNGQSTLHFPSIGTLLGIPDDYD